MAEPAEHHLDVLSSPVRQQIVDLLANRTADEPADPPGLTARELGEALGLHTTTVRFHIAQLEKSGLVESVTLRGRVGRPGKLFRTPRRPLPPAAGPGDPMHALAELLGAGDGVEQDDTSSPEEAGRRWARRHLGSTNPSAVGMPQAQSPGAWLGKIGTTVDLLAGWGYRPEVRTEGGGRTVELTLEDCPFLALARTNADVVCGVHRGLLKGALEAVGEPDTDVGLRPLVGPRTCLARVTTRVGLAQPTSDDEGRGSGTIAAWPTRGQ